MLGYVLRRTDSPDDAASVLAETFLVAWRRLDDMPSGEVSHLWLYGVARRILANHRRGERRRTKLADRVRDELAARLPLPAPSGEGTPFAAAFRSLSDGDREVLALHGWEGLDAGEIHAFWASRERGADQVAPCSPAAASRTCRRACRRDRVLCECRAGGVDSGGGAIVRGATGSRGATASGRR